MGYLSAPKVNKEDLQKYLSKYFKIGELVKYQPLEKGLANCLYRLKTTKGEYALKISIRHNSEKLDFELALLNYLKNLPIPKPVKTVEKKYDFDYKGHRSFIYPFLPGKELKNFSNQKLFEVGRFLGKLHLQSKDFKSPIKRTKFYTEFSDEYKRIINENRNFRNFKIRDAVSYIESHVYKSSFPKNLPIGAIHIDVKPENTLFAKGHLSGVVDFDNSYIGILAYDLADTIMWFSCSKGKIDISKAKEVYMGYKSVRKLNKSESDNMSLVFKNILVGITLCCIDYTNKGKVPEKYTVSVIDNFLEVAKGLKKYEKQFQSIFR